jgi:hypothetical protein
VCIHEEETLLVDVANVGLDQKGTALLSFVSYKQKKAGENNKTKKKVTTFTCVNKMISHIIIKIIIIITILQGIGHSRTVPIHNFNF